MEQKPQRLVDGIAKLMDPQFGPLTLTAMATFAAISGAPMLRLPSICEFD